MSWDALIAKTSGEDFHKPPENAELLPMGSAQEIREIITRHFPETDWQRNGTGFLRSDSLSLEFRLLGKSQPKDPFLPIPDGELVQSIGFSARGYGDPVSLIANFARQNKWSVVDAQEGTWMDLRNVSDKSWKEFTGYRDGIFKDAPDSLSSDSPPSESAALGINLLISLVFFITIGVLVRYFIKDR